MEDKKIIEEQALKRCMIGAFFLALWGIAMAVVTDSSVILLDGMYNLIPAVMSCFSLEIIRLVSGKETRACHSGGISQLMNLTASIPTGLLGIQMTALNPSEK